MMLLARQHWLVMSVQVFLVQFLQDWNEVCSSGWGLMPEDLI